MTQSIKDRGERTDGSQDSEQDGSGAERLAGGDIETGSGINGDAGVERLLHGWVVLGFSGTGSEEVRRIGLQ
jgi:hypothetical protein